MISFNTGTLSSYRKKISHRLTFWQNKLLNKVARFTLVRYVMNSIPNYYFGNINYGFIGSISRNFLWKGNSNSGVHLVGWNKITKHKKLGDIRIWKSREANTFMLGKLVWGLHWDCDFLMVQVLKHKYISEETFLNIKKNMGSVN